MDDISLNHAEKQDSKIIKTGLCICVQEWGMPQEKIISQICNFVDYFCKSNTIFQNAHP